jgi:hypothetical protein
MKTCLDCGFLTIQGREITSPERIMLATRGQSASMPAHSDKTRCFKNIWEYDLHYVGDSIAGVFDELESPRDECTGFARYEPGLSPARHLERQEEERKGKLQLRIARLGFYGALIGGVVTAIILEVLKWVIERASK